MQNTSSSYLSEIKKPSRSFECKVTIGDNIYTNSEIVNITIEDIQPTDGFYIGSTVSKSLELTLSTNNTIYSNSVVKVELGLNVGSTIEYILMGYFNIDDIERTDYSIKLICYDNMIKFEKSYFSNLGETSSLKNIVNELAQITGVEFTGSLPSYTLDKLEGFTCREILGFVASICGGNAYITRDGKFTIKTPAAIDYSITDDNYIDLKSEEDLYKVGAITCKSNDKEITKGTVSNSTMEIAFENPWVTESILNDIYNKLKDFQFIGYSMKWQGDFSLDVGDIISITDIKGNTRKVPILSQKLNYNGGLTSEIGAKGESKTKNEFSSTGNLNNKVNRIVTDLLLVNEALINKADIEDLKAVNAEIENLIAENVTITGKLSAIEGEFGTLKANVGVIDKLVVNHTAEINNLIANKADITDLTATNIKFDVASGGTLDLQTLISRFVTGENGQFINISSSNSVIANATIKNAMIESLSVDKLLAGRISTNKFTVSSDDGGIEIVGATQQFKDKNNKVRIQMGQDTQGNFNFILRGEDGTTTLIDHTGIKEKAIADDLIKENMVAADAIGEKQINYSSLITGLNKDTNTQLIKASKVAIDLTGQSLEVAFNSLKSNVDGLEIGGRNYVLKSNTEKIIVSPASNYLQTDYYTTTPDAGTSNGTLKKYTISVWLTPMDGISKPFSSIVVGKGKTGDNWSKRVYPNDCIVTTVGNMKLYTCTFTIDGTANEYIHPFVKFINEGGANATGCTINKVKLEEGTKPTDYTVAPEDIDKKIESNTTAITVAQGKIEGLISENSIIKGDVTTISDKYTSLKATVDGINATVASHTSSIGTINTNINSLSGKVATVENKYTSLSQDLSGFKTTVGNTYSTKSELSTVDGKVNSLSSRVGSTESSITQLNNKIALKVEATDIKEAISTATNAAKNYTDGQISTVNNTISDKVAEIKLTTDSITQKVNSTESTVTTHTKELEKVDGKINTAINTGNLYIKGTGYNRPANKIVQLNGVNIVNEGSRGLHLTVIKRSDLSVISKTNYDVYGTDTAKTNLTDALNKLDDSYIVVLTSYDAIATNNALDAALIRCGGSGTRFGGSFHRVPYALVGIPGIGKGSGIEVFTSIDANAPFAEINTKIVNGTPQGINTTSREVFANISTTNNKVATIETNLNGITQRVSSTESTVSTHTTQLGTVDNRINTAVNNIQIGGRNLVKKKSQFTYGYISANNGSIVNTTSLNANQDFYTNEYFSVKKGESVYFSAYTKAGVTSSIQNAVFIHIYNTSKTWTKAVDKYTSVNSNAQVQYVATEDCYVRFCGRGFNNYNHKAEYGTKATDWTPAPEDIESDATTKANNAQTNATNAAKNYTDGQITTVNKTITDKVAEIKATTDSITSRVSKAETTLTSTTTTANNALNTANSKEDKNNRVIYARGTGNDYPANRILKVGSKEIYNTGGRGARVTALVPSTLAVYSDNTYDLHAGGDYETNFINKINELNNGDYIIIVTSCDNAYLHYSKRADVLCKIGGFAPSTQSSAYREAYALIGRSKLGKGNGIEMYIPRTETDKRYAEVSVKVSDNGAFMGVNSSNVGDTITNLTTRVSSAESKITDTAITNVVKQNFYTKTETENSITSKGYQTSSQVKQTVDAFQLKFEQSGGCNILRNSAFKKGYDYWTSMRWDGTAGGTSYIETVYPEYNEWTPANRNSLGAVVVGLTPDKAGVALCAGFDSHKFTVKPNTTYTLNCLMACHRAYSWTIEMLCYDSNGNRISGNNSVLIYNENNYGGRDRNNWRKIKHTWTTQSNAVTCHLRAFMNEWNGEQSTAFMWICEPIITEGNLEIPWTPNADEVYTGITTIDQDGVTVSHSNGSYSKMSYDGFKRYDSGVGRNYHYYSYAGSIHWLTTQEDPIIPLPSEISGKVGTNYSVMLSIRTFGFDPGGAGGGLFQYYIYAKNKTSTSFTIDCWLTGWDHVKNIQVFYGWMDIDYLIIA